MSGSRKVREPQTDGAAHASDVPDSPSYFPPVSILLKGLGIAATELQGPGTALVSRRFLRALMAELLSRMDFDDDWYAQRYPDVEAARLAGDIKSLREHFTTSGYFEGRLPAELLFDPRWYRKHYRDIAEKFPASDPEGMRIHFLSSGYFEGRAGTGEMLAEVERWQALAKG